MRASRNAWAKKRASFIRFIFEAVGNLFDASAEQVLKDDPENREPYQERGTQVFTVPHIPPQQIKAQENDRHPNHGVGQAGFAKKDPVSFRLLFPVLRHLNFLQSAVLQATACVW
jgi:hypothetical protein